MKQIKRTKKVAKKHESGRSMIEMVGVLAIMGLITAAAFVLITSALRSQRLVRIDDDVSAIAAGVRLLYANQPSFDGIATAANATNAMTLIGYNSVKTPFNTSYTLLGCVPTISSGSVTACAANTSNNNLNTHFMISFNADSNATCQSLVKRLEGFNGGHAIACASNGVEVKVVFAKYADD